MRLQIIRGGQSRKRGRQARDHVDRELHGVVLESTAHLDRVPDQRGYNLRSGRSKPYGALLWFIDRAVAIGTPYHVIAVIPGVLAEYIKAAYEAANRSTDRAA